MKLLQIFLYILLFFYLLQWAVRAVLRWKIRSIQKEMASKGGQPRGRGTRQRAPREGEVRVDAGAAHGRKIDRRIGDYVEYEEIDIVEESGKNRP